jgi:aryl-alcohol dehydrogenase-like predicted oxidoreductase
MKYQTLGKTDINVSAIVMGGWALGGGLDWGSQDEADSVAAVHAALDLGINFFDTAEEYGAGRSEEVLGRALAGRRQQAVISTKVSAVNLSTEGIPQACERSLKRLQTDTIDLYQVHWPAPGMPIDDVVAALQKLQAQGKIRAVGVSNFGILDLSDFLARGRCDTIQLPYNLAWRAIEYEVMPKCRAEGVGILPYSPLMQGLLTGKYATADDVPEGRARTRHFSKNRPHTRHGQPGSEAELFEAIAQIRAISQRLGHSMSDVSLAWVLHQPGVDSVIIGARNPHQLQQNIKAVELDLSPEIVAELTRATEPLKQKLGPNPDLWQAESRFR